MPTPVPPLPNSLLQASPLFASLIIPAVGLKESDLVTDFPDTSPPPGKVSIPLGPLSRKLSQTLRLFTTRRVGRCILKTVEPPTAE